MAISKLDLFTRKTSVRLKISEEIVESVMKHQWKTAHEATYNDTKIEISGLCTLSVRPGKIKQRIKTLETIMDAYIRRIDDPTIDKVKQNKKINSVVEEVKFLNSKL